MTLLSGWGRLPQLDSHTSTPMTLSELRLRINEAPSQLARGMGRSYGDSALNARLINTGALKHLRHFDAKTGLLDCQAGVTLSSLLDVFVPQGWFLPVTPGTRWVSIGGAIASDVHGKNHHHCGCFSEFVDSLDLLLSDGSLLRCSRHEYAELFHATCGGMGLTGVIVSARLRLQPIASAQIDQRTIKATNLAEMLQLFEEHQHATYSVAWIDCLASGANLGRSVLMLGEHAEFGSLQLTAKKPFNIPLDAPSVLLNSFTMQVFNTLYYHRARTDNSPQRVGYEQFFYPLDGIGQWNRLYGKSGFVQYQFVLPKNAGAEGLQRILERISKSRRGSFLAVLKVFGQANNNLLSFPMAGYTLALDFKYEAGLFTLLHELDAMVLQYGGRLYLCKDARMSEFTFKQSYPNWEAFQQIRKTYGALGTFTSLQSQRLGLE